MKIVDEKIEFDNVKQLYDRLKPALKTKQSEMRRMGYSYVREEDIWNYLKEVKWKKSVGLSLCEMVSDILNTEDVLIDNHLRSKLNLRKRRPILEEK